MSDGTNEPGPALVALLSALSDGTMSPDQYAQLGELIVRDAAARRYYLRWVALEARLQRHYGVVHASNLRGDDTSSILLEVLEEEQRARLARQEQEDTDADTEEHEEREWARYLEASAPVEPVRHIVIPRPLFYTAVSGVAATLVLLVYLVFAQQTPHHEEPPRSAEAPPVMTTERAVASIVAAIDVKWEDAALGTTTGTRIMSHRPLRLVEGIVKLRFEDDAELIIEAPAELTPIDVNRVEVATGRLVGRCATPRSRGFIVDAPQARLIDVGTEFGVQVEEDGSVEAYVFEGRIDLSPYREGQGPAIALEKGASQRVDPNGRLSEPHNSHALSFVRDQELTARVRAREGSRYHEWLAHRYALQRDPALLVFYDFERQGDYVPDLSRHGYDAFVVGGVEVDGRFPGNGAMAFHLADERLAVTIPDAMTQATFVAWVRLDQPRGSGRERFSGRGLLLPDDVRHPMRVHWQFHETFVYRFGYYVPEGRVTAGSTIKAATGRWQCMAVVYDQPGQVYRLYIDGREVASQHVDTPEPITIGATGIGNWLHETRPLGGTIDEMWVLRRALSVEEIKALSELRPR